MDQRLRIILVVVVAVLGTTGRIGQAFAQQQQPSLADIAKKAEDARAKKAREERPKSANAEGKADDKTDKADNKADAAGKPTSKTYTNKDLTDRTAPASVTPQKDHATTEKPATVVNESEKGEAYWRGRFAPIRAEGLQILEKLAFLRRRIYELTVELSGIGPLNARRGGVETERQRLITEADALDSQFAANKARQGAVLEEGRVVGALPGWFR
jgi:cytoskeletal protein RodZ